jgi:hypothetical protein
VEECEGWAHLRCVLAEGFPVLDRGSDPVFQGLFLLVDERLTAIPSCAPVHKNCSELVIVQWSDGVHILFLLVILSHFFLLFELDGDNKKK